MSGNHPTLKEGKTTSQEFFNEMVRLVNKYHRMILEEVEMTQLSKNDEFTMPYEVIINILSNYMASPNKINQGKIIPLSCGIEGLSNSYYQTMKINQYHLKGGYENLCPVCGSTTIDNVVFMNTYKVCPNKCKENEYIKKLTEERFANEKK